MRGCAPLCLRISISSAAFLIPRKAASTAASGLPTKVTTVRFVVAPGSTSSSETPSVDLIASLICLMMFSSRPSEKFGTHSISFCMLNRAAWAASGCRSCVSPRNRLRVSNRHRRGEARPFPDRLSRPAPIFVSNFRCHQQP